MVLCFQSVLVFFFFFLRFIAELGNSVFFQGLCFLNILHLKSASGEQNTVYSSGTGKQKKFLRTGGHSRLETI